MVERKIIDVDSSSPLISKKKKKQGQITLGIIIAITLGVVALVIISTKEKVVKIGDYTVATVSRETMTSSTEASGSVVMPTQVSIVAMSEGYALELNVSTGDNIDTNTILATLEVPELDQERVDLENSIESKEISLEQIILSNKFTGIDLENSIERKIRDIQDARDEVEKMESLKELKSSRESDYEEAVNYLETLQEELEDLRIDLEKETTLGALNIKAQETQIKQSQLSLERINEDIEKAKIKTPIAGDILWINSKLSVPGSLINQNSELFTVANSDDVYIDLEVYEEYRSSLSIGDKIEVLISSNIIEAEIVEIGSIASLSSDSLAATIEVRAKPVGDIELTLGASAVADIPLGTIENTLTLPRGSYLTTGNQKYLYVIRDGVAQKTKVAYGALEDNRVQVISGVKEGDKVIISSYQNFIDQDQILIEE